MKTLHLRDSEAREWKIGTVVIERGIPIKFTDVYGVQFKNIGKPCYYHPNDKVAVKETYDERLEHIPYEYTESKTFPVFKYVYKSDKSEPFTKWKSPATMSFLGVRHFATITSIEAVERDGKWLWKITMEATS